MKTFNKKILGMAAVAVALPMTVMAATTNLDVTTNFLQAITLGNEVNMDFGDIEYTTTTLTAADIVTLSPDNSMVAAGAFSSAATGTAGSVDVLTGQNGETLDVFCDATATMTDGASGSIDVTNIVVAAEDNLAVTSACNGVGGAATAAMSFVLNVGTLDTIAVGGTIDGATAASFAGGAYSTASAGGDNIQIDIVYN